MAKKDEVETVEETKSSKDEVVVAFRNTERTFSKEVHGKDFKDLAKQFAEKHEGTIV